MEGLMGEELATKTRKNNGVAVGQRLQLTGPGVERATKWVVEDAS